MKFISQYFDVGKKKQNIILVIVEDEKASRTYNAVKNFLT